jgi:plasmid stabilization system protein ParE
MPAEYDLTAATRQDVRDIWRYTAEQWGEAQADHYTGLLETRFQQIAAGSALSRTFSAEAFFHMVMVFVSSSPC